MFFDGHIINLVIISNWGNIKNLLITRFIEFIPVYFVYWKIFTSEFLDYFQIKIVNKVIKNDKSPWNVVFFIAINLLMYFILLLWCTTLHWFIIFYVCICGTIFYLQRIYRLCLIIVNSFKKINSRFCLASRNVTWIKRVFFF